MDTDAFLSVNLCLSAESWAYRNLNAKLIKKMTKLTFLGIYD